MAKQTIKSVSISEDAREQINENFTELYAKAGATTTSSAAELNILDGVTATTAELNYLDIATLGVGAESKAVVIDAGGDFTWPTNGIFKYFQLKDADDTLLTATLEYVNQQCDYTLQQLTPGVGITAGVNTIYKTAIRKTGGLFHTVIFIDLTGLASSTTDLDIIGTTGASHIGQVTAAKCGTIIYGTVTCLETPAGGVTDIDFYRAVEGTGAFDDAIGGLTETVMLTKGGAWAAGASTHTLFTNVPTAAEQYMYMTCGAAGTAGTYTAGQFLIELWGI